jgi:hypothetical protein
VYALWPNDPVTGCVDGVGDGVDDGVGEGVTDGLADADAEAETAAFAVVVVAALDALLAAWLLLVGDVQPATLTMSTASKPSITTVLRFILPLQCVRAPRD